MTGQSAPAGAPPSAATDAVLVASNEMPEGSQKVEELDFNQFTGRQITVDDLMSGMNNMGFQASSIGEAVRIINNMVSLSAFLICLVLLLLSYHKPRGVESTTAVCVFLHCASIPSSLCFRLLF